MNQQQKKRIFFRRKQKQQPKVQKANYAFIDAQNLNRGTQHVGFKMNWKKFREYLKEKHNVEKAFMFIGYVPDNENLYNQMKEAGYTVVLKPTVDMLMSEEELADEKHVTKGNVDADLVMYIMKELPNYQKALLVSGDGDFYSVIEYLKEKQKLGNILVPNYKFSSLLKPFEANIIRLDQLQGLLAYNDRRRDTKKKQQTNKHKQKKKSQ
jgi:uncharacterized LabA/DUF88 family protein